MIHHRHKTAKSGCYWHILCPCPKMNSFPDFPWHQQGQSTCEMKSALPPAQWDEQNGKSHLKRAQNQVKTVFALSCFSWQHYIQLYEGLWRKVKLGSTFRSGLPKPLLIEPCLIIKSNETFFFFFIVHFDSFHVNRKYKYQCEQGLW